MHHGIVPNEEGVDCAYGVLKAAFRLELQGVRIAEEQVPIVPIDEHIGDPKHSSLKHTADVGLAKLSTDVLLCGHAYPPRGEGTETEVGLKVGALEKTVRVFGDRTWERGFWGLRISSPRRFQQIPLLFERAFGGTDSQPNRAGSVDYEPRNPVGRGIIPKRSQAPAAGTPLPNLEDPKCLIRSPTDRPAPACFGPICAHWEPRKSFAGTYDQVWLKKRAPYLPKDFNPRFHQVAPPDLVSLAYLKGGEPVEIYGASPHGSIRFQLPRLTLEMVFHLDGQPLVQVPNLDTVCFEPDQTRFWMLWRACQVTDKKLHRLRELEVLCKEYCSPEAHRSS